MEIDPDSRERIAALENHLRQTRSNCWDTTVQATHSTSLRTNQPPSPHTHSNRDVFAANTAKESHAGESCAVVVEGSWDGMAHQIKPP